MNMFYEFFRTQRQTQTVEVPGGKFEFKALSKDIPLKVLWFTKHDIMQSTVAEAEVRNIAPFRGNGVACEIKWPNGHQAITLYFFENGELWDEKGFILNKDDLVYMYKDELRIFKKGDGDKLLMSKKELKDRGYNGSVVLDKDKFYFRNDTAAELVPFNFFDYGGKPLLLLKKEYIARAIMQQIRMFITDDFAKNHIDSKHSDELTALTWEAKTATIEDVKRLIALEKDENNLSQKNTEKVLAIINTFESAKKPKLFTRYMELFFTAYEQISMHRAWIESQWFGKKNLTKELDEHHSMVYQKMHFNMHTLAQELMKRTDVDALLDNYAEFEKMVREYLGL